MNQQSSGRPRTVLIDGDEVDAVSKWRYIHKKNLRPGVTAWAKRKIRRRERRLGKEECREGD